MQMNQISLEINKAGQIINEPVVLRVGEKDQTITVNLLKDGQPYTSFTTATFFANKPSGAIVANDPANISNGVITYTVPQALVNEFGKITNAYFLIDGKTSTESFVIAVLQGVKISDDLNDYIPGMSNLNVIYDKWKAKLQTITDELAGIDAPKEVKNVIDNELKNYTDQVNELQKRITALKAQLDALEVPVNAVGTNLLINSNFSSGLNNWAVNQGDNSDCKAVVTTDSDGDTCIHITGTGNSCGLYCSTVSFNQNQVTTGSVLVKGTATLAKVGLEGRPASNFGTISTESYSKVGSTCQASSKTNVFVAYFSTTNGVIDVYVKFAKLEKGSIATDYSLNPLEISTNTDVQTEITNALSDVKTQIKASAVGTNLFLQSTATVGYVNSVDGTVSISSDSANLNETISDYIPVNSSFNYTFQMWGTTPAGAYYWFGIGLYDSDKKFISRITNSGLTYSSDTEEHISKTLTTTSATAYVRVSFRKYNNYKVKLEKGSVATDWCLNPSEILTQSDYAKIKAAIVALGGSLS